MIRDKITDPWHEVSWDEAIAFAADRFKDIQAKYGRGSIGGITSSRCTNEEVYVVQKMVRAAFRNNNVDTCARVCHSPTGYGLKQTFGTSAGTQDFKSVDESDVIMIIGANPTDGHPVFASRMKKRLREGAKLIVVDPRRIDIVRSPHVEADYHLPLQPGTNVAVVNALLPCHRHRRPGRPQLHRRALRPGGFRPLGELHQRAEELARSARSRSPAFRPRMCAPPPGSLPRAAMAPSITASASPSTARARPWSWPWPISPWSTGNIGRDGVGVNPLRGQNNVQGSCDMGSFPHEFSGYRHVSDNTVRELFEKVWKVELDAEPGLRIPNMFDAAVEGTFKGLYVQGEDIAQSDPNTKHVTHALEALECVVVQDLFLNETAAFAHVFFPGTSFLEKDGTFTNAERRINRVRPVMAPKQGMQEWEVVCRLATAMGYPMSYTSAAEIMDEIARVTPTFAGVSFERLDRLGSVQWPCNDKAPEGTPIMHVDEFVRGKGRFMITEFVPTPERTNRFFPLILTTGRILSQYNVGAQTRRTENVAWHTEDVLEIHPHDAEVRGIKDGAMVSLTSRVGATTLRVRSPTACRRASSTRRSTPGDRRQRDHHREFRLGDQLPGIQGDGGAGDAFQPAIRLAEGVGRARAREQAHRRQAAGRGGVMAGARAFELCRSARHDRFAVSAMTAMAESCRRRRRRAPRCARARRRRCRRRAGNRTPVTWQVPEEVPVAMHDQLRALRGDDGDAGRSRRFRRRLRAGRRHRHASLPTSAACSPCRSRTASAVDIAVDEDSARRRAHGAPLARRPLRLRPVRRRGHRRCRARDARRAAHAPARRRAPSSRPPPSCPSGSR